MAYYGNKFYANVQYPGYGLVQLLIKEKNYSGANFRMGNIQSLTLEVGGGNEPPYAPVLKTTLRFSVADAFDVGTTDSGETCITTEGSTKIKNGQWEEFYTNDATKYLVQLIYLLSGTGKPTRQTVLWQGYITPDSWEEAMVYHGSITVVARDMLGSLSDFTFDAPGVGGLITVQQLVNQALGKCKAAMEATFESTQVLQNYDGATVTSILSAGIPEKAFEGKSWWDALTSTLEALGMVMRFDNGGWKVTSLRYLPQLLGRERHDCEFINRSGIRTLDPPIKEVSAVFDVDVEEVVPEAPDADDFTTGEDVTVVTESLGTLYKKTITTKELAAASGNYNTPASGAPSLLAPPNFAANDPTAHGSVYFLANTYDAVFGLVSNTFTKVYGSAPVSAGVFRTPCQLRIRQNGEITESLLYGPMSPGSFFHRDDPPYVKSISLYITGQAAGVTYFYKGSGEWVTGTRKTREDDAGVDPLVVSFEGATEGAVDIYSSGVAIDPTTVVVDVVHVEVSPWSMQIVDNTHLFFVPLDLAIGAMEDGNFPTEYSVVTDYNNDYNVRIERTPAIGSVNTTAPGVLFQNVLQTAAKVLPDNWNWPDSVDGYPLEVMVQAQVLQFYAAANSIFTGNIHDKTYPIAVPGTYYDYYDRWCILQRGTFNFMNGFLVDAAIREYMTWEQVWQSFAPSYVVDGRVGRSGGSSGGSSGGGGGSAASVNALTERVDLLDSLIGEDADHNAYVKPYGDAPREFKNTGGAHVRDLTLARATSPSGTADLEVIIYTDADDNVHEYLHSRLPIVSDQEVVAGGTGSGGGGGTGGTSVTWGNDASNGYETLVVEGYTGNQRRVALSGHLHAISDIFTGIGSTTPSVGDTLVYGQNGWAYGAAGGVSSVISLTGDITQAQLRTALGLRDGAYRGIAANIVSTDHGLAVAADVADAIDAAVTPLSGAIANMAAFVTYHGQCIPSGASSSNQLVTESGMASAISAAISGAASGYQPVVSALGGTTKPVYIASAGTFAECSTYAGGTRLTINGTSRASSSASIYAPNTAGSANDYLVSNGVGNAPTWETPGAVEENGGALVTGGVVYDFVTDGFVTIATAQTITGQKTFTPQTIHNGGIKSGTIEPLSSGDYDLGTAQSRWNNAYLFGELWLKGSGDYGNKIVFGDRTSNTDYVYIKESADDELTMYALEGLHMDVGAGSWISAGGSIRPKNLTGGQSSYDLGSLSARWNNAHIKRWYPTNDSNIYVEYDSTIPAFYFHGNIVASGAIVAGGIMP